MGIELIIGLIAISIILINLELFIIPGTTIFGVMGALGLIGSVVLAYMHTEHGNIILVVSCFTMIISAIAFMRLIRNKRFALQTTVDGRVNEIEKEVSVEVGQQGLTINAMRPNGKVKIGGQKFEAFSNGEYIDPDTEVKIIKITRDKIFVKPVNQT